MAIVKSTIFRITGAFSNFRTNQLALKNQEIEGSITPPNSPSNKQILLQYNKSKNILGSPQLCIGTLH